MKNYYVFLTISILTINYIFAGERIIEYKELPKPAQQFVSNYFIHQKVVNVNLIRRWKSTEYKVLLTNGGYVLFDQSGKWTGVFCGRNIAPEKIIPPAIQNHITNNYPKTKVTDIQYLKNGDLDVKLTNGYHIRFNRQLKPISTDVK